MQLLCTALLATLLCAGPGLVRAEAQNQVPTEVIDETKAENKAEIKAEINGQNKAPAHSPVLGLVNWPGAVVYPKLNEGKPLITVAAGEKVELLERSNLWWKIRYGDKVGWINRLFLEVNSIEAISPEVPKLEPLPAALIAPLPESLPTSVPVPSQALNSADPESPVNPIVQATPANQVTPGSQGDPSMLNLPEQAPTQTLTTPEPEPVKRSVFQMSMLALDSAWKSKFQKRGLDASQPDELFTAQLVKNSKLTWAPQVIAPSRLVIGKDYLKLWLKSTKAGYVYVWSEAEDGGLTLVFPNQRDMDHRVTAGEILYLPRKNWPIKSSGPAGQARLLVMVSEVPRALPPPTPLMDEISASLAPPSLPSVVGHEILKRHPFWMSNKVALDTNPALLHFLNPDLSKEDCNPKKPQCSNNYGVKSIKLMKVEPVP